jgi:hypothetical protein
MKNNINTVVYSHTHIHTLTELGFVYREIRNYVLVCSHDVNTEKRRHAPVFPYKIRKAGYE